MSHHPVIIILEQLTKGVQLCIDWFIGQDMFNVVFT